MAYRSPRATFWCSWLHRDHTPETRWLLLATVVVTALALLAWQQVFHGQLPDAYRDAAQGQPVCLVLVAGAGFALVNAAVEEAILRGVLQTSLQPLIGPTAAVLVQAAAFGLLHVVGIPPLAIVVGVQVIGSKLQLGPFAVTSRVSHVISTASRRSAKATYAAS